MIWIIVTIIFFVILILIIIGLLFFILNKKKEVYNESKLESLIEEIKQKNLDIDQIKNSVFKQNDLVIKIEEKQNNLHSKTSRDFDRTFKEMQENDKKFNQVIDKITRIDSFYRTQKDDDREHSKRMFDEIKILNQVFTSNYKRGKLGEITLKWVLEECFGENEDIVIPQYVMKNGSRPDYFLKTSNGGIPIDSKFPYDNFLKIIDLNESSDEYKKEISRLKLHLKKHINDLYSKYISKDEEVEQVFLFLPSETLFSFIHSKRNLTDIRKYALDKKIILTSSSNLPAALRIITLFERDKKRSKNFKNIINNFKDVLIETKRTKERWDKIDRKLETIINDKKNYSISIVKLTKKIENTIDSGFNITKLEEKK